MQITYTGITAELKDYNISLTAQGPDDTEKTVVIQGADIREFYGCNPAKWLEKYGEDEKMLFEMFELVNGIQANC